MDFPDTAYPGKPPWDIGRPRKEFVDLPRRQEITISIIDIGCGTGEYALVFWSVRVRGMGDRSSPRAVRNSPEKAAAPGLTVHFVVPDTCSLPQLNRKFNAVTDSGLVHTLSDEDRPVFADTLAAALSPGGKYFMLCFSDLEPGNYGPEG